MEESIRTGSNVPRRRDDSGQVKSAGKLHSQVISAIEGAMT
jgi:hypothetical protein